MVKNVITDHTYPVTGEYKVRLEFIPEGFKDIANHWAEQAIVELQKKDIISVYDDHQFKPDHMITRAEATIMLATALKLKKPAKIGFTDVSSDHLAYKSIAEAMFVGIIQGYPDGSFAPEKPLSRAESAVMFANVLGMKGIENGNIPFPDTPEGYWALPLLRQMLAEGWISGYADE